MGASTAKTIVDTIPAPAVAMEQRGTQRRAITWRSVLLGTLIAIGVCTLVPYNDYALSYTRPVIGYLPPIAVLVTFVLVVGINGPLHRYWPRKALSSGELAVVLLMTLLACSLINWGLMRFFIPMPVAPFRMAGSEVQTRVAKARMSEGEFWKIFLNMHLPSWLFPVGNDLQQGRTSPVVQWFYTRVPEDEPIPFGAWIKPLCTWGIFIAAMLATLVAIARLVLDQWANNERLPFPLVQVQAALIESPRPGFALNDLFRSPGLWIGLCAVFFIYLVDCMHVYFPRNVPRIPLGYDMSGILADPPWAYVRPQVKKAAISFIIIGVTYFIRSRVAFSLWGAYLLVNLVTVEQRMKQTDISNSAWADQHLGACVAFVLGMLWIGRHHWLRVLRNAFGIGAEAERTYRLSFWIAALGIAIMIAWLTVAGVHIWMAAMIVLFILLAHVIVSRVLAETGLPIYRTDIAVAQIYTNMSAKLFSARDIFFAGVFNALGPMTSREGAMGASLTGLGVYNSTTRSSATNDIAPQEDRRRLGGVIGWSLFVAFVVCAFATIYCQYSYPTPPTPDAIPIRNYFGAEYIPVREIKDPLTSYTQGRFEAKAHRPWVHMATGFGVTVFLEFASLRWANWPLLPVGYITSHGSFLANVWFSVFLGWLVKVAVVRLGGASLFQKGRSFFIGLIFGEALAAGIWLLVNAGVVLSGGDYKTFPFQL